MIGKPINLNDFVSQNRITKNVVVHELDIANTTDVDSYPNIYPKC
jgi:hypothetical protein